MTCRITQAFSLVVAGVLLLATGCSTTTPAAEPTTATTATTVAQAVATPILEATVLSADANATTQPARGSREEFTLTLPVGWQQVELRGGPDGTHQAEFARIFPNRPDMQQYFPQYVSYIDTMRQMGTVYLAVPVSDPVPSIPFETTITVVKMPNTKNVTVADMEITAAKSSAPWIEAGIMRSLSYGRVSLPGGEALEESYLYQSEPGAVSSPLFGSDTFQLIHNGSIYTVGAIAPEAKYGLVKFELAHMMQSFRFID